MEGGVRKIFSGEGEEKKSGVWQNKNGVIGEESVDEAERW